MVIVLAERDRDYRTAAHAEHVGERHQQDEDRVGQADGGYLQGIAGLSDEKGVRHVVHHGDEAADDARNRHCGYCTRYRRFAEESIIIQIVHVPYFGNLTIVSIEVTGQPALRHG